MKQKRLQVGDKIRYRHDGGEHEHVIHGVRYEHDDAGHEINVRYLIPEEYVEHYVPIPENVQYDEKKLDRVTAMQEEIYDLHKNKKFEEAREVGLKLRELHAPEEVVAVRVKEITDSHEHSLLCPIVEREVFHEDVIEHLGSIEIPSE